MLERRWLRVVEVAERLGCHPVTIRKAIARGQLPYVRKGGIGIRIDWPAFEKMLETEEVIPRGSR
jgi:excisionase family DNA binding protein